MIVKRNDLGLKTFMTLSSVKVQRLLYLQERESRKRVAEDSKAPLEEEKEKNTNALIESYTVSQ